MSDILTFNSPAVLAKCLNPTADDWPALKIFFHKDDAVDAASAWEARLGEYSVAYGSPIVVDSDGVGLSVGAATQTLTGTLPTVGTGFPLLIVSGVFSAATAAWHVGDSTDASPNVGVRGSNTGYVTRDASNYLLSDVLSAAPTYPLTGIMGILADTSSTNEALKYAASNALDYYGTSAKSAGGSVGTLDGTWGAFSVNKILIPANTASRTRCLAFFNFASKPVNVGAGILWMAKNPGYLYPGWIHQP